MSRCVSNHLIVNGVQSTRSPHYPNVWEQKQIISPDSLAQKSIC